MFAKSSLIADTVSDQMERVFLLMGSLSGGSAVVLGAFAAHALRARLTPVQLASFETGVRYHMYHALALLAVGLLLLNRPGSSLLAASGWLFAGGTILFSGSLYLLALSGQRWLGAVTPLGGVAFIAGWAGLLLASLR